MNKVIIRGNLGADPQLRTLSSGDTVGSMRVATSFAWNDKVTGKRVEQVEWHHVALRGRNAELAAEYLSKGDSCLLEGRLKTREWTDTSGVKRYVTEIVCERLEFGGNRKRGDQTLESTAPATAPGSWAAEFAAEAAAEETV